MLPVLLAATLLSAAPPKLAQAELRGANMSQDTLSFFGEHLAGQLRNYDVTMITAREMATLFGLERQKELVGCADSGCVAELANALGVDGVLVGDIGHFGDVYQIDVKVLAASGVGVLAAFSDRVESEQAALDTLDAIARELSRGVHVKMGRPVPDSVNAPPIAMKVKAPTHAGVSVRTLSLAPLIAGAAIAATGTVLLIVAQGVHNQLIAPTGSISNDQANGLVTSGNIEQYVGFAAIGLGSAAVIAGVFMFVFGAQPAAAVSLSPTPGGAAFSFSGVWP